MVDHEFRVEPGLLLVGALIPERVAHDARPPDLVVADRVNMAVDPEGPNSRWRSERIRRRMVRFNGSPGPFSKRVAGKRAVASTWSS